MRKTELDTSRNSSVDPPMSEQRPTPNPTSGPDTLADSVNTGKPSSPSDSDTIRVGSESNKSSASPPKSEKIFVSSTDFDLLDVRAEVLIHLKDLGLVPSLFENPGPAFQLQPTANSIETCLVNVRDASVFLCIVSQRYGSKLGEYGFEDLSATHLEYREARKMGIPIFFFVRDRALADYEAWRRASDRSAFKGAFVKKDTDSKYSLLEFIDEHCHLSGGTNNNWRLVFSTSVDLKQRIAQVLQKESLRAILRQLREQKLLPLIIIVIGFDKGAKVTRCIVRNISEIPAMSVMFQITDGTHDISDVRLISLLHDKGWAYEHKGIMEDDKSLWITISYLAYGGHYVFEKHEIIVKGGHAVVVQRIQHLVATDLVELKGGASYS